MQGVPRCWWATRHRLAPRPRRRCPLCPVYYGGHAPELSRSAAACRAKKIGPRPPPTARCPPFYTLPNNTKHCHKTCRLLLSSFFIVVHEDRCIISKTETNDRHGLLQYVRNADVPVPVPVQTFNTRGHASTVKQMHHQVSTASIINRAKINARRSQGHDDPGSKDRIY